jgi:hypothetical protein
METESSPTQQFGKIHKEFSRRNRKGLCQFHDILQSHIPLTALDPADVVAMQPGPFGQFLLRVASLVTELP